jgi:hypothetical protein
VCYENLGNEQIPLLTAAGLFMVFMASPKLSERTVRGAGQQILDTQGELQTGLVFYTKQQMLQV